MKFKTYTGITWSNLELMGLLEDEDSRVYFERCTKHFGLHPFQLTNLHAALNEILSSNLNSYDSELKGFLLAYKNPKLLAPTGDIFYDSCYIHIDVEADFYVFRPEAECSLKGVVNKKGLTHIGVLVHKAFNVSIPKKDDEENWVGDNVEIGQEVRFTVTYLDLSSRLPFFRGILNSENYLQGCKLPDKSVNTCNNRILFDNDSEDTDEIEVTKVPETKPTRRKLFPFFSIDSKDSSEEDTANAKKQNLKMTSSKKNSKKDTSTSSEKKTETIKITKKSKVKKASEVKIIEMESVQHHLFNNSSTKSEIEENQSEEDTVAKKRKVQLVINNNFENVPTIKHESQKPEKNLNKKTSKISSIIDSTDGTITVKQEKNSVIEKNTGSVIDKNTLENSVKSEKHSMNMKDHVLRRNSDHSMDDSAANECIPSSSKRRSKKSWLSESKDENTFVTIKTEKSDISVLNNTVEKEVKQSPSKEHKKKRKHSISSNSSNLEIEGGSTEKLSPTKRLKYFDKPDTSFAIPNIRIKVEKVSSASENTQEEDNGGSHKISKKKSRLKETTLNSSNCDVDDDKEKKHQKAVEKHAKRLSMQTIKVEPDFGNVTIKLEKPDVSSPEDRHNKSSTKDTSKLNSPKKKRIENFDYSEDEDATTFQNSRISPKKAKTTAEELKVHGVAMKKKYEAYDTSDEELLNKSVTNHDSSRRIKKGKEREKKHSSRSPNTHSRKSQERESSFDFTSVKAKVEKIT